MQRSAKHPIPRSPEPHGGPGSDGRAEPQQAGTCPASLTVESRDLYSPPMQRWNRTVVTLLRFGNYSPGRASFGSAGWIGRPEAALGGLEQTAEVLFSVHSDLSERALEGHRVATNMLGRMRWTHDLLLRIP